MNRRYKYTVCPLVFAALLAFSPAGFAAERASDKPLEASAIEKIAREAKSASDHAEVARQYELRGRLLEATADRLEREIRQHKASMGVMETKWPAMVANARERREQVAMQTRRAAQECYRLAEYHKSVAGAGRAAE